MERYDVVSTEYIVSGFHGQMKEYMSPGQVYDFVRDGHEIASHSVDHPDLTQLSDKDLTRQLEVSDAGLTKCYGEVTDLAPPFGASNAHTTDAARKTYQTSRSVMAGFNSPDGFNPYLLKVQNVRADTSPTQLKAWLDTAQANHVWLILVYHQVSEGGGEYTRTPTNFENDLMAIKASGLNVKTVHEAYLSIQK
jgi:peptidoglycan/xylan/chitin deacetylase (PgdA/CDA1 family)